MCVFCRYLLVVLLALPQGLCCVATGCESKSKGAHPNSEPSREHCSCCRTKPAGSFTPSVRITPTDSPLEKCAPTKQCECKCRFHIGIPRPVITLDSLASLDCYGERPVEISQPEIESCPVTTSLSTSIRLQILYCNWRC